MHMNVHLCVPVCACVHVCMCCLLMFASTHLCASVCICMLGVVSYNPGLPCPCQCERCPHTPHLCPQTLRQICAQGQHIDVIIMKSEWQWHMVDADI